MGRSPCCDIKAGLKKGPWTPEEDEKLLSYIEEHGHGSWRVLPAKAGLQRCGKSCRLRWSNYLRPDIKRGKFTLEEEHTIIQLHALLGNRWSAIATHLTKRTDNEIKNYWNTHLKKRLDKMGIDPITHKPKNHCAPLLLSTDTKNAANLSHMAQWESARLEAEARLVRQSKLLSSPSCIQVQLQTSREFTSTPGNKLAGPTRCLDDVLKAWIGGIGGWSTAGETTMESPTSTMSSSAAGVMAETTMSSWNFTDVSNKEENKDCIIPSLLSSSQTWDSSGTANQGGGDGDDNASFMEKAQFTDLLLGANRTTTPLVGGEALGNADHELDVGGGFNNNGIGECFEEGDENSYWDSILNLVTSSPASHSHGF